MTGPAPSAILPAPLAPGDVHVIELPVPDAGERCAGAETWLAPEERARARRFISPLARRRFVAGRLALRTVLSRRAGIHPSRIALALGPHGKPGAPGSGVRFNLAHSDTWIVIAFTERRDIGVDVDDPFTAAEAAALAPYALAPGERARLAAVPPDARADLFQRQWIAKEALLKASGDGFSRAATIADIDLQAARAHLGERPYALAEWIVDGRTRAAVAVSGVDRPRIVRHRRALRDFLAETDNSETCTRFG